MFSVYGILLIVGRPIPTNRDAFISFKDPSQMTQFRASTVSANSTIGSATYDRYGLHHSRLQNKGHVHCMSSVALRGCMTHAIQRKYSRAHRVATGWFADEDHHQRVYSNVELQMFRSDLSLPLESEPRRLMKKTSKPMRVDKRRLGPNNGALLHDSSSAAAAESVFHLHRRFATVCMAFIFRSFKRFGIGQKKLSSSLLRSP